MKTVRSKLRRKQELRNYLVIHIQSFLNITLQFNLFSDGYFLQSQSKKYMPDDNIYLYELRSRTYSSLFI